MAASTHSILRRQSRAKQKRETVIDKSASPAATQRAFRHELLIERDTLNEHVTSFAEFQEGLRESLGASPRDLQDFHRLKLWLGVEAQ